MLKVLSYWNLNFVIIRPVKSIQKLKVLSYWNLNAKKILTTDLLISYLKYYHIGI